jgi:hypothetical protein
MLDFITVNHLISPAVLVMLAVLASILKLYKRQYEYVIPRALVALVYLEVMLVPELNITIRGFLVRWTLTLMFLIEILSFLLREVGMERIKNKMVSLRKLIWK